MTDNPDNRPQGQEEDLVFVAPVEPPPSRVPPDHIPGAIKWLRDNLFNSPLNSLLTIVVFAIVVWFLRGTFGWAIFDAEWNVVTSNLRLLMVGQYAAAEMWRVNVVGIGFMVLCGLSLGLWYKTAARPFFLTAIIVIAVMVLVPLLARSFQPAPIRFLVGAETNTASLLFVADEGDSIGFGLEQATNEEALADGIQRAGYVDIGTAVASRNAWFDDVARPVRNDTIDLANYDLTIEVRLLNADGEVIDSVTSSPDNPEQSLSISAPYSGWYVVEFEQLEGSTMGFAWLRLDGVETLNTRAVDIGRREEKYGTQPTFCEDGTSNCLYLIARRNLRFEGSRTLGQFFSVQLAPFFNQSLVPVGVGIVATAIGLIVGMVAGRDKNTKSNFEIATGIFWLVSFPLTWFILYGIQGNETLPVVPTAVWGGLLLTLILTFISIAASLPLSVLLALGRNSDLPVVSVICTTFIEVVRGVPLITILFFAKLIVPFFSSALVGVDDAIRMLIGLTLFTAAYQAEVIRGGLQIVPSGQIEAAKALGLSSVQTMYRIIMPQAIRAVIPAMMSQFVSLFKDTTLVSIVGLFELLGIVDFIVNGQQINRPFQREAYIFVGIIYFVVAYVMSQISRRLEESGSGATRR